MGIDGGEIVFDPVRTVGTSSFGYIDVRGNKDRGDAGVGFLEPFVVGGTLEENVIRENKIKP